jgi:hypothetical protein
MRAFQLAAKLDEICRNCANYDADMEIGGMYGICIFAERQGRTGPGIVKEANQYCNEAKE